MPSRFNAFALTDGDRGKPPMIFVHGYGCDQAIWRDVAPAFELSHRVILYDQMGSGASQPAGRDADKYARLEGFADDLQFICEALDLRDAIVIGHSASAMIGLLACLVTSRIGALVMVGGSPCYQNDGDYRGGFSADELHDILEALEMDHQGWVRSMAASLGGEAAMDRVQTELQFGFSKTDPAVLRSFGRAVFLSDYRPKLAACQVPTLILQCRDDPVAPEAVGEYMAGQIAGSQLVHLDTTGHYPQLSAPALVIAAIADFAGKQARRA